MKLSRPLLVAVLVAAGCASYDPSHAPTCSADGRAFADRACEGLPMANVGKLADGVWRGGEPDAAGLRALKEHGFKTIVDLRRGPSERREAEALGLRVVEIPLRADVVCDPPDAAQVRRFLDTVTDPANQPVYIHCAYGRDRTGTMCAIYRMEVDGWTREEALEEMHAFGFRDWYADFRGFVGAYKPCGAYAPKAADALDAPAPAAPSPAPAPPAAVAVPEGGA